jgi:dimethylamine monooxygenase subunit A
VSTDEVVRNAVDGRTFVVSMGLRTLYLDDWMLVTPQREDELRLKANLLRDRHEDVVATRAVGNAASAETLKLVQEWLRAHHPELPTDAHDETLHPIDAAGRLVQEDLCVMVRDGDQWVLAAASLCFPSRWRLADKMGASLREIHHPVPGYERIAAPTDRFFDRLDQQRPVWRTNWTLIDDPTLFQPNGALRHTGRTLDADPGEAVTFRVERQTLRALPESGGVLFTIHTLTRALGALDQAMLGDLAATLRTIPPESVEYKGWSAWLDLVIDWIDARA